MSDLKNPRVIYFKGLLFLLIGVIAGGLIVMESTTFRTVGLLGLCVWGFARAYYFAFYVIEHYVDSSFKFSGLVAFVRYVISKNDPAS